MCQSYHIEKLHNLWFSCSRRSLKESTSLILEIHRSSNFLRRIISSECAKNLPRSRPVKWCVLQLLWRKCQIFHHLFSRTSFILNVQWRWSLYSSCSWCCRCCQCFIVVDGLDLFNFNQFFYQSCELCPLDYSLAYKKNCRSCCQSYINPSMPMKSLENKEKRGYYAIINRENPIGKKRRFLRHHLTFILVFGFLFHHFYSLVYISCIPISVAYDCNRNHKIYF